MPQSLLATPFFRTIRRSLTVVASLLAATAAAQSPAPAPAPPPAPPAAPAPEVTGTWIRAKSGAVQVFDCGGKLCAKLVQGDQAGFEMLHGMEKRDAATWTGKKMKHPDMPGFMTFNGTVTWQGNKLTVKGCAMGQSMCDSEVWTRKP